MAYTSIWAVKGWLGKLVIYVENPDKTSNPVYAGEATEKSDLGDIIGYAMQSRKTKVMSNETEHMQYYISGVNCRPSTARDAMLATKRKFGKDEGVAAYHGIQSFAPDEATPEIAHEIGVKLAETLWGNKFEVLVTTHLDSGCLHNHFVVNTVSFADGLRYYRSAQDYRDMQQESDKLCRAYGLSIIDNAEPGKSKHYSEWNTEHKGQPTYRTAIRADVDEAIK
ncbi:MAG: relaxase/mobilization nuclease domain-containing protein, partial [Oscillospiraceae bacterium]|nr:relaxase/mobilization nuclease domain-containing protein [Oscillospiraceae bacterium]